MRLFRPTLASQLILIFIGAVLVAKAILVSLLFVVVQSRVDDHEENSIVQNIVSVHQKLHTIPRSRWEEMLVFAATSELHYWISETPKAPGPIDNPVRAALFHRLGPDILVQELEVAGNVEKIWEVFGPDLEDTCFQFVETPAFNPDCPYRVFSLQLADGTWLNASTDHEMEFVFLFIPVTVSAALMLFFLTLATIFTVNRVSRPLRDLSESAERLGRGEIVGRLPVKGPREVASLTASFNTMQERLTRFVQDRTRMLGAISHDLRTPITSLRIQAEFIEDEKLQTKMAKVLDDMGKMVRSSLDFARLDNADDTVECVDLAEAIRELAEDDSRITFESDQPTCPYPCRRMGIKRAIQNILENAVTYGTQARVKLKTAPDEIRIQIQDDGPGIADDLTEEVFEPFYRIDEARNVETGSVGLGLSIARTIIHKHGGQITLSNLGEGLEVTVVLPR